MQAGRKIGRHNFFDDFGLLSHDNRFTLVISVRKVYGNHRVEYIFCAGLKLWGELHFDLLVCKLHSCNFTRNQINALANIRILLRRNL